MTRVINNEMNRDLYMNERWTLRTPEFIYLFNSQREIETYLEENFEPGEDIEVNKFSIIDYLQRIESKLEKCGIKETIKYIHKPYKSYKIVYVRNEGIKPDRIEETEYSIIHYVYKNERQYNRRPYVKS